MDAASEPMVVYLYCDPESRLIQLLSRVELNGVRVATLRKFLKPGQHFHGYPYRTLWQMGSGRHELTFPAAAGDGPPVTGPSV